MTEGKVRVVLCEILIFQLFKYLTRTEDEAIAHVTGVEVEGIYVPTTYYEIDLEESSPVYARGSFVSCRDAQLDMVNRGYPKILEAHDHPGKGPYACRESPVDIENLSGIQQSGSRVIGLIFSRDGYFHVFSVCQEFEVRLFGKSLRKVNVEGMDELYKID